jgi:hypothetical protein
MAFCNSGAGKPVMLKTASRTHAMPLALLGGICAFAALMPDWSAQAQTTTAIPQLMLPATAGWTAFLSGATDPAAYLPDDYLHGRASIERAISLGAPPDKVAAYLLSRSFNEWIPTAGGIGPISDGPEHPFYNNNMASAIGKNPTYRVADLTSEAARNLMPWAVDALKKQNALVLANRNGETRQARCWETGVPDFHEDPHSLYFIQTPKEVVMIDAGRVRHVFMNVPHSRNPEPSWYGESVGRYDGDTLVVDTIGLNDKTFVDGFRTPHTAQLHVIERFRVINGGKALDVSFTVDDRGTFYQPWGARRPRYRSSNITTLSGRMEEDTCPAGNEDRFNQGFDPVPSALTPDF